MVLIAGVGAVVGGYLGEFLEDKFSITSGLPGRLGRGNRSGGVFQGLEVEGFGLDYRFSLLYG